MNFRTEALTNLPYWDVATQYFKGDCVVSGVNDGIYVFGGESGANLNQTTIRGGTDPALGDADSGWWPMQSSGLLQSSRKVAAAGSVTTVVGAGAAVVVPDSLSLLLATDNFFPGTYMVSIQAQCTVAAPGVISGNSFTWILTPNGTTPAPVIVNMTTSTTNGTLAWGLTGSAVVSIPSDGTGIALSAVNGVVAWAAAPTLANVVVTYSRLGP
jgi:hypothetical protein